MKNKGGAPKKEDSLKLTNRMIVSFNESEYLLLKEKGLLNSKVLRKVIMDTVKGKKIVVNTNKDPRYILELNRIGNNINQIIKKANSNQLTHNDIIKIWSFIDDITLLLKK